MKDEFTFTGSLEGSLLVASPGMGDPRFMRSVIFMCTHTEDGAFGLSINQLAQGVKFSALLEELGIAKVQICRDVPVVTGGPVERNRGFLLHSPDVLVAGESLPIAGAFAMTATLDMLRGFANGEGPEQAILALGYSGWGPGQLEQELQDHAWLTLKAEPELVFATPASDVWEKAMDAMGIDARLLTASRGRA